jgi:hypothetical protein
MVSLYSTAVKDLRYGFIANLYSTVAEIHFFLLVGANGANLVNSVQHKQSLITLKFSCFSLLAGPVVQSWVSLTLG